MKNVFISETKINRVAKDWANLTFTVQHTEKRLYITRRKLNALYGYIDLTTNQVYPNQNGVSYKTELESILRDLTH